MSSLDNWEIIPSVITDVQHRSECVPYYGAFWSDEYDDWSLAGAYLPLIAAPMSSVIDYENYLRFDAEGIISVIPRSVPISIRLDMLDKGVFVALGLDEFRYFVSENPDVPEGTMVCLDLANGHMREVIELCSVAKKKFGKNLILMTGNIANPETYYEYAKAGIDYVRCSVGSGNCCSTSYMCGIHCSMDKLIQECKAAKTEVEIDIESSPFTTEYKSVPKIVADGGFQTIRQIVIALALGADYCMLGRILAECEEACGEVIKLNGITCRKYYGMSTERAQKEMGHTKLKPAEGVERWVPVKYKLSDWTKQFVSVISSTMSYCNTRTLEEFIGSVQVVKASDKEYEGYEKSEFI